MFDVSENGDLIYNNNPDVTPIPSEDGSLYSVPDETPAPQGENGDGTVLGDAAYESAAPPSPSPDVVIDPVTGELITPSPSPDVTSFPELTGDLSLTISGDVYIYPDIPENQATEMSLEDLEAARSVTSASVTGLPNSTSLQYLEDVARGYPAHYKYMAFKTDASYSQSMVLYIGAAGEKNASQNRLDFTDVDRIEVNYIRTGSTNYYQYVKNHYSTYQIPYDTNVFLYTNVVDGYAQFDIDKPYPVSGFLFLAAAIAILLMIFRGGGKS